MDKPIVRYKKPWVNHEFIDVDGSVIDEVIEVDSEVNTCPICGKKAKYFAITSYTYICSPECLLEYDRQLAEAMAGDK